MIDRSEATDPDYWVGHLRNTVAFRRLHRPRWPKATHRIFIEVGPGKALASLAGQHAKVTANQVICIAAPPRGRRSPTTPISWPCWAGSGPSAGSSTGTRSGARRAASGCRLPTYAFQRAPYFIEPGKAVTETAVEWLMRDEDAENWGYRRCLAAGLCGLRCRRRQRSGRGRQQTWLIFADEAGLCDLAAERLRGAGHAVITVRRGDSFRAERRDGLYHRPRTRPRKL